MELLASFHAPNPNLFVVGDEKQAIFRFQGASLENFLYFKNLYPKAKLITLAENYRSTQSILDSAQSLMAGSPVLLAKLKQPESKIAIYPFESPESEIYFVAHDIKRRIEDGLPEEEMAVLYRNNEDAFPISDLLKKIGVPHQIESDLNLFSEANVRKLITILRAINYFGDNRALAEFLHVDILGVAPLDVYKLARSASQKKKYSLFDLLADKKLVQGLHLENQKAIDGSYKKLCSWVKKSKNSGLLDLLEAVVKDSGLLENMLGNPDAERQFEAVNSFFDEAKHLAFRQPDATLADFFAYIETVKKHSLFIKKKRMHKRAGRVRLMTMHKAKGLEFEHVYIIKAYSGHLGDKKSIDRLKLLPSVYLLSDKKAEAKEDDNADERRLFYVALTRAKKGISITYAKTGADGREQLPSSFLAEIKSGLVEECDTGIYEKEYAENKRINFEPKLEDAENIKDKNFVRELFISQGFSPTALNNYLECPWKYFYQNLIRLPSAPTKHQAYGTAVHAALQDFFRRLQKEKTGKEFLLQSFTGHLNKLGLPDRDTQELLAKGTKALAGWYDAYHKTWNENVLVELRLNGILLEEDIRLTGVLDKVEFQAGNGVKVVDYKTGRPKTRNAILGKTRSADGNYFRQLVFYKILLDRYEEGKYNMQAGIIDFIEPDEKGKYHQEAFKISEEDTKELIKIIQKVAREILNLSFWDRRCGKKDCAFCSLRAMMQQ